MLNWEELKVGINLKKDLITGILESERSNAERNYMKHFNNNTNDDDNNNTNHLSYILK